MILSKLSQFAEFLNKKQGNTFDRNLRKAKTTSFFFKESKVGFHIVKSIYFNF